MFNKYNKIQFKGASRTTQGHTNYVKRCRVVVYELLREYSSTRAAIRDGAVNLNECTTRGR